MLLSYSAKAYDVEIDGIYYNLSFDKKTAEVTNQDDNFLYEPTFSHYIGDIQIPSIIEVENVQYSVNSIGNYAFSNCTQLKSIIIPASVLSIGYQAFYNCRSLSSISIPNAVTSIGDLAFYNCSGLNSLVIPNSVTIMGHSVFEKCTSLSSAILSNQLQNIDARTFYECKRLESIIIPDGIEKISGDSFYGCDRLTKIEFHCKEIGSKWFSKNTIIKTVVIGDEVTTLHEFAFLDCNNLMTVKIGKNIELIEYGAFEGCRGIQDVYCYKENVPLIYSAVFHRSNIGNATLHVPSTALDAYKTSEQWKEFGRIIPLTDDETSIYQLQVNAYTLDVNNIWYTLGGKKLDGKPMRQGIYIHNLQKVVIR